MPFAFAIDFHLSSPLLTLYSKIDFKKEHIRMRSVRNLINLPSTVGHTLLSLGLLNSNSIGWEGGGRQDRPCEAKFSEKCPC